MSTTSKTLRYYLFGQERRAPRVVDPADMGTCFGMEMMLDEPQPVAPPVVARPPARQWWRRLAVRRAVGA